MLLRRRILDAVRSPRRLWWLGARAAQLIARGELGAMLARARAHSPDASRYRDWLQAQSCEAVAAAVSADGAGGAVAAHFVPRHP